MGRKRGAAAETAIAAQDFEPDAYVVRTPLTIRFDIQEAGCNIDELADELRDDGGNAAYVIRRIEAEIKWMHELLAELSERVR